jgi:RPA family protein
MAIERLPAKKVRIFDVVNGKFFSGNREEMKPSYLITPFGEKISRVNLIATVIDKFLSDDENYSAITIDDGTGSIRVKGFKEKANLLKNLKPGDLVLAIGKIKEFGGEIYINAEIVRKVDPNFENLRKLEILDKIIQQKKIVEEIKSLANQTSEEELKDYVKEKFGLDEECLRAILEFKQVNEVDYKPKVLELIKNLDEGDGVEIGKILELCNLPENIIEDAINELLSSGVLYEPVVGRLKLVKS